MRLNSFNALTGGLQGQVKNKMLTSLNALTRRLESFRNLTGKNTLYQIASTQTGYSSITEEWKNIVRDFDKLKYTVEEYISSIKA